MQDYKTEHPFDIRLTEEQQMTWDTLKKFAELEMRPNVRKAEEDGMPSKDLLPLLRVISLID